MALTDTAVRQARTTGKDYTLNDAHGLLLFVSAKGKKKWHFRFSWMSQQQRIAIGPYPEISLKDARARRDEWACPRFCVTGPQAGDCHLTRRHHEPTHT
ncbi:Arm DNA-binding domain-containing protein [Xanthomonas citri]|uniref:Arm DNA-binding domain-containing protein n=1 Tax=Xanthomonas citri TaxID=346 RepID=UPI001F25BF64|nr:Arm DNA-binding domain-containing protein [Xanthomonas citri]